MNLQKDTTIVMLSHYYKRTNLGGGPPQEVRDYVMKKVACIAYIEHPFPYADDKRSSMTIYKNGAKIKTYFTPALEGPDILFYIADIFITWYFIIVLCRRIELCIALDGLNVFSTLLFRKIGIIKVLIYYTIDYTPYRFTNKLLNKFYLFVDEISCYFSDAIWVLSERMVTAREQNGVDLQKSAPSILLPMGADTKRIHILPEERIKRHQIVFVGHLLEKQGIQLILQALPQVIKQIPNLNFIIVGQGAYKNELIKVVKKLQLEKHVTFSGFVEKHKDVEKILCESAVGLAPYVPSADNYTYYTDPGKPKLYLACGLPVIITDVPASAKMIEKHGAGICVSYEKKAFEKAIVTLLRNDRVYKKYRANAIKLSRQFDTNTLIKNAIAET